MTAEPSLEGHLAINGLNLYYEVYGEIGASRTPLLLIPGAFMATDSMTKWAEAFSRTRTVVVFDQQGHGRTPDCAREMSYGQFAEDAAELLRVLDIERASVMGYSQGGGVAIQLAIRHPSLVDKLVSMSATFRKDGWYASALEAIEGIGAEAFAGSSVERAFERHTPDREAFTAYVAKMKRLNVDDQDIGDDEMRSISARTMVIVGDADGVKPEHAVEMFRLCGGGDDRAAASGMLDAVPAARLLVLPAMSHVGIAGESELLVPLVDSFLDDVMPTTQNLFA